MATAAAPDYIDQIDNGVANVVSPDGEARIVALADLPAGVKEGHYVSGGQIVDAPPETAEGSAIRARLAAGDKGGPISLADAPAGPTVMSPLGDIPASTPGLPAPTDEGEAAASGAGGASHEDPAAAKFIDATIAGPQIGAAEAPKEIPLSPLGPNGEPASSEDLQQRVLAANEGEKKALEGVSEAQEKGREDVQQATDARDDLRRQQAADLAAEQLYVRDRQKALDDEDAANLAKARDQVIPDFWKGREGDLVGAAITAALSGAASALVGRSDNPALDAINHSIDSYYTRERQKIDSMYQYAERKGMLNDKIRSQYAGELSDLMQHHAYTLQSAADRIQEVSDNAKGLVDQRQTDMLKAQLQSKAAQELQQARTIDEKNYDSKTKREIADADLIKANAAMAKVHKGKGGGGGAGGASWMDAARAAAQQPGATELSVAEAARNAGYKGKDTTLKGFAQTEIANVGKQVEGVDKQMKDFETQLYGSGGKGGPAQQLSRIQAMKQQVAEAAASGDPDRIKAAVTAIKEEAGGMLSGGKTTRYTGHMLQEAQSLEDKLKSEWSKIKGNPTEGKHFVAAMGKLLDTVEGEKLQEVHEIRQKAVDQTLGPGGTANSDAAKRHVLARFKGLTGNIKDASGNPVYQEGGAKGGGAAGGVPAGARAGKLPDGSRGYALGGQMFHMDGTPFTAGK